MHCGPDPKTFRANREILVPVDLALGCLYAQVATLPSFSARFSHSLSGIKTPYDLHSLVFNHRAFISALHTKNSQSFLSHGPDYGRNPGGRGLVWTLRGCLRCSRELSLQQIQKYASTSLLKISERPEQHELAT